MTIEFVSPEILGHENYVATWIAGLFLHVNDGSALFVRRNMAIRIRVFEDLEVA